LAGAPKGHWKPIRRYQKMVPVPTAHAVYEIKATLVGIEPPIWRRLQVPSTMLLCCLHDCLQALLGWTDSHLHQFERDGKVWSVPEWYKDEDIKISNESRTPLNRVLKVEGDSIVYKYDFGDNWLHEVALEKIVPCDSALIRPVCLAGERSCPPEDVGGVWGYNEFLEVIFEPGHEEFDHYRGWADGFQPEYFDLPKVNETLSRMRWPKRHRRSS
jgi:Plasmid pRiA4b ORF-3-like protein